MGEPQTYFCLSLLEEHLYREQPTTRNLACSVRTSTFPPKAAALLPTQPSSSHLLTAKAF